MDEGWNVEEGKAGAEESVNGCTGFVRPHWAQCVWEVRVTHLTLQLCSSKCMLLFPFSHPFPPYLISASRATSVQKSCLHLSVLKEEKTERGRWRRIRRTGRQKVEKWVVCGSRLKDRREASWLPLTGIISSEWQSVLFLCNVLVYKTWWDMRHYRLEASSLVFNFVNHNSSSFKADVVLLFYLTPSFTTWVLSCIGEDLKLATSTLNELGNQRNKM